MIFCFIIGVVLFEVNYLFFRTCTIVFVRITDVLVFIIWRSYYWNILIVNSLKLELFNNIFKDPLTINFIIIFFLYKWKQCRDIFIKRDYPFVFDESLFGRKHLHLKKTFLPCYQDIKDSFLFKMRVWYHFLKYFLFCHLII